MNASILWTRLISILFPGACAACGAACGEEGLCAACERAIAATGAGARCRRCGAPLGPYAPPREGCEACRHLGLEVARVVTVGPHEGALRLAIRRLKFARHEAAARPLGRLLAARVRGEGVHADVVVPVPLDPARERERGFNQAAAVASAVAGALALPCAEGALARVRPNAAHGSQTKLSSEARAAAVAEAFAPAKAARARLGGKRVLLVDDVLTTGATLNACARACRAAGAASVVGACVARRMAGQVVEVD